MSEPAEMQSSNITIKVSADRLRANLRIVRKKDTPAVTEDKIRSALKSNGVTYGILDEGIKAAQAEGEDVELIEIARGKEPIKGTDGTLEFLFETQPDHTPKSDENGHIDYHEVNFIQAAKEGQELVRLIPPGEGTPGIGVDGQPVSAQSGKERRLPGGQNTVASDDGLTLLAGVTGAIVFTGKEVNIRDVITISGDVDHTTGNIHSPCSVRIRGNVNAGFKVDAEGDIEIGGIVADAEVISRGNILVKGGFVGRGDGLIQADGNVTVKRVEGENVRAGHDIYIGGNVLNAHLTCGSRVVVKSAHGHIHGGEVIAEKEIIAPVLGNEAWTPTVLRVASPDHLLKSLRETQNEIERVTEDFEKVKAALYGLVRLQMDNKLPPEKVKVLEELRKVNADFPENLKTLNERLEKVKAELSATQDARIVATKKLYPGVKAYFGVTYQEVKQEMDGATLVAYGGRVVMDPYDPRTASKSSTAA